MKINKKAKRAFGKKLEKRTKFSDVPFTSIALQVILCMYKQSLCIKNQDRLCTHQKMNGYVPDSRRSIQRSGIVIFESFFIIYFKLRTFISAGKLAILLIYHTSTLHAVSTTYNSVCVLSCTYMEQ